LRKAKKRSRNDKLVIITCSVIL